MNKSATAAIDAAGLVKNFGPLRAVHNIALKVHPGELITVEYEVVNERQTNVTGQAVPSYGPQLAGEYFKKLECFCFTQQTLQPGETRRMPVLFVVDPKLPRDVNTIAISYTFFQVMPRGGKG